LYDRLAELATRWMGRFDNPPDLQEIQGYIDAGLQLLEGRPTDAERVAFLTYQAFWHIRQLQTATHIQKAALTEQALASGHEALRIAEELNDPLGLSLALDALGFIYAEYHKYNEAHQVQHRRLQLEGQLTERMELYDLYLSLGSSHEQVADYPNALVWFGRAWSIAQTMESPMMLLNSLVGRMRAWRQWNRWEDAREVARELLRLIEQYQQDEKKQFWALETLATIAYRVGNRDEGDQYARQCKRLIDQQVERSGGDAQALLATRMHAIHLAKEDWARATADYKAKVQASEPLPSPEVVATLAELFIITGESAEVQESTCERAVALAEESGARKSLAIAFRARGRMHLERQNWNSAEDDLRQALRRCEVLDLPWERGNTLYALGLLYRRRASILHESNTSRRNADMERARYHFEQALGFFEAIHALPSVERVRLVLMQDTRAPV
jgi:tetratricopeptide (TPR) repeat protein